MNLPVLPHNLKDFFAAKWPLVYERMSDHLRKWNKILKSRVKQWALFQQCPII